MKRSMAVGTLVAVLFVLSSVVAAQDRTTSLNEILLSGSLQRGDGVYVTDTTGQRIKGVISDVSLTGLTLTRGAETWTLTDPEITRIERQDPIWTGAVTGAGIGYGALLAYCLGNDFNCFTIGFHAYPFVAASAALGALWDLSMHKTLYEAPGDSRVAVAPMMGEEGFGAQVSVSW